MNASSTIALNTENFKIKSSEGHVDFYGVNKITKDCYVHLKFSNGKELKCSEDHPISTIDGIIRAKNLNKKQEIETEDGHCFIVSKRIIKRKIQLYDIINSGSKHLYYSNGILSHNCEFLGSSGTLIDGRVLGRLTYDNPITQNDSFKLFHEPRTAGSYVITVDTSRGLNQDYSAFLVIDISELPYKVVASYRDNAIEPMLYPEIIYSTALRFNNAVILVEINDIGQQVADILHQDLEYDNILYTMKGATGNIELSGGFKQGATRGIRTTKQTKRLGCSNLKALIENNKLIVSDYQVLYELQRFVVINGSYAAEQGNDDLVMCLVLFAWLTTQQLFIDTMDVSVRKNLLLLKQEDIDQSVPQFGFIDDRIYEEDEPIVNTSDFDKFLLN